MSVRTVPVNRTVYFRVPDEIADRFEDFVRDRGLNRNRTATSALVGYMDSWTSGKAKDSDKLTLPHTPTQTDKKKNRSDL